MCILRLKLFIASPILYPKSDFKIFPQCPFLSDKSKTKSGPPFKLGNTISSL